jgi:hypothetical protein
LDELKGISPTIVTLEEMLSVLALEGQGMNALHLKSDVQTDSRLGHIARLLTSCSILDAERLLVFDLAPSSAEYLKARIPTIEIFCSVSHSFDIQRYGPLTGSTLLSLDEFSKFRSVFDGAWLDEWDLVGPGSSRKEFYNEATVSAIRDITKKIAIVAPELHATSPNLLGSEAHEDGLDGSRWLERIYSIKKLQPEFVCTDKCASLLAIGG